MEREAGEAQRGRSLHDSLDTEKETVQSQRRPTTTTRSNSRAPSVKSTGKASKNRNTKSQAPWSCVSAPVAPTALDNAPGPAPVRAVTPFPPMMPGAHGLGVHGAHDVEMKDNPSQMAGQPFSGRPIVSAPMMPQAFSMGAMGAGQVYSTPTMLPPLYYPLHAIPGAHPAVGPGVPPNVYAAYPQVYAGMMPLAHQSPAPSVASTGTAPRAPPQAPRTTSTHTGSIPDSGSQAHSEMSSKSRNGKRKERDASAVTQNLVLGKPIDIEMNVATVQGYLAMLVRFSGTSTFVRAN